MTDPESFTPCPSRQAALVQRRMRGLFWFSATALTIAPLMTGHLALTLIALSAGLALLANLTPPAGGTELRPLGRPMAGLHRPGA